MLHVPLPPFPFLRFVVESLRRVHYRPLFPFATRPALTATDACSYASAQCRKFSCFHRQSCRLALFVLDYFPQPKELLMHCISFADRFLLCAPPYCSPDKLFQYIFNPDLRLQFCSFVKRLGRANHLYQFFFSPPLRPFVAPCRPFPSYLRYTSCSGCRRILSLLRVLIVIPCLYASACCSLFLFVFFRSIKLYLPTQTLLLSLCRIFNGPFVISPHLFMITAF